MLKIIMRIHIFACAYLTILFIEIFTLVFVRGQTIQDMDTLLTNLTTGYNKLIRPVTNQRDAVDVSIHYDVMGIQDIDEVKGQITVNFVLTLRWTDARLSWVPADYNMIESVVMEHGTVWKPEMKLGNPATIMTSQEYTWPHVRYSSDGSARWAPNGFYEISCSINIKYYPMDVQTCAVKFQVLKFHIICIKHNRFYAGVVELFLLC